MQQHRIDWCCCPLLVAGTAVTDSPPLLPLSPTPRYSMQPSLSLSPPPSPAPPPPDGMQLDPQAMQELQALLLVGRPSVARMIRRCAAVSGRDAGALAVLCTCIQPYG